MKTTLEIPDAIFRRAKAKAAEQGIPLRQFVSDAVAEKLAAASPNRAKAILKLAGGLRHLRKESARINRLIEQEFEKVEM
jgi:ribonuclease D